MKEVGLKQSMNCSLSSVRNGSEWRNKGGRKSGGVRKANNYYADGGRDGRMEEERFGGKYSEQQAREGGSERAKEAARLTDLLTDSRRRDTTACPPARSGLSG